MTATNRRLEEKMSRVKADIVHELHKPRKHFKRRRVIIKGLDDLWQPDLADFKLYTRKNKGFKYILAVLDYFSRYLGTPRVLWKSKLLSKLSYLKQRQPKNLQTDAGKEFCNQHFNPLMNQYDLNHYPTYSVTKTSIAERVIRTAKEKIYKDISQLDDYLSRYNSTIQQPKTQDYWNETERCNDQIEFTRSHQSSRKAKKLRIK